MVFGIPRTEVVDMNSLHSFTLRWLAISMWLAAGHAAAEPSAVQLREQATMLFGVVRPVATEEVNAPQAVLGRALFWDDKLSLDGKTACATCHPRDDWSADRRRVSINAKGQATSMNSQPVFMAQEQSTLRWLGDRSNGAHQAERSITGSMGLAKATDILPLLDQRGYAQQFKAAFPQDADPVTPANYARALQAYQRTLRTPAAFDAFLLGDDQALSARQLAGLDAFIATGCASCHSGPLLGGNALTKFGVIKDYWLATRSTQADPGRFAVTQVEADRYVFRVPMLRNIAKTEPYFHDGSVARLDDAVRVMAEVQLGRSLSAAEVANIVAFLESLTGELPEHYAAPAGGVETLAVMLP
jgi:cytochrome c peroxidase